MGQSGSKAFRIILISEAVESGNENLVSQLIKDHGADVDDALVCAVENNNESMVKMLIDAGADVNHVTDPSGKTVLFCAVEKNIESMVQLLVESGADVNRKDKMGKTILMSAMQSDSKLIAQVLIDAGADVNLTDEDEKCALLYAAQQSNNESIIRVLVDAGADVNMTGYRNETALCHAVVAKNENMVRALINAGTDVNITRYGSKTALCHAVEAKNENMVHALLDAGADCNIPDYEGKTALWYAFKSGNKKIVQELVDAGADEAEMYKSAIFNAVEHYDFHSLHALVEAGGDVNATDKSGKTALFYAVKNERYTVQKDEDSMVKGLIDVGADVNIKDEFGNTALASAIQNCTYEQFCAIHLLINAGVDVNIKNQNGETALILACKDSSRGSLEFVNDNDTVIQALIDAGADVNITDCRGITALMWATNFNKIKVVRKLINAGADVNISDNEDNGTALFFAIQFMYNKYLGQVVDGKVTDVYIYPLDDQDNAFATKMKIVRLIVEEGNANVNTRDVHGRTPLFYAIEKSIPLSSYLIEKGANVSVKDNFNLSIMSIFIEKCIIYTSTCFLYPSLPLDMNKGLDFLLRHGFKRSSIYEAIVNVLFCQTLLIPDPNISSSPKGNKIDSFFNILNVAKEYKTDCDEKATVTIIINNILFLTRNKSTAMQNFCECLVPEILSQLIELGADPNSADLFGNTALHYAACLPIHVISQKTVMDICHLLDSFGVAFNFKNLNNETPLLFCCNQQQRGKRYDLTGLKIHVDVCKFLLEHGSSVEETTRDFGHSVFHLILSKYNPLIPEFKEQKEIRKITMKLLELFCQKQISKKGLAIKKRDEDLNTPLHVWASFADLSVYQYDVYRMYTFMKQLLKDTFNLLVNCGAKLNDVNENNQTPLHICRTWTAVNLLLDAGANPKVVDSEGRSPLLVAANKLRRGAAGSLYRDVFEVYPQAFWKSVLKKGLDPWTVDKHGKSVMSVLVELELFVLAKALLEVARDEKCLQSDTIAISLLNAICRDKSTSMHWKSNLVEIILKSSKSAAAGNENGDTPLHLCCRNIVGWSRNSFNENKVHCTIAKQLLFYGADCTITDKTGQSCLDIADKCPLLKDLLMEPINIDEVPKFIPWTSVSQIHERTLAKVARCRESKQIESYWYHQDHIQNGSFGAVFVGISEKDGREVAIKRIEKLRMQRPEVKREITNLTALADCEQVVRYLCFFEDKEFSYVVLELMDGNLDEYLDNRITIEKRAQLCQDIVTGLEFLHNQNILHRDLKPTNILFKAHPKPCLKISDFGLSRRIDSTSTTVYGTYAGTRCWIAPELLMSDKDHSESTDVFACGILLHYILSIKNHPFSPADCTKKSLLQINHETEANVINGKMEGWDNSLSPEATDLVKKMLDSDESKRPGAGETMVYPFFWSKKKKSDLLITVGNQPEFECPRAKRSPPLTAVETDLETKFTTIVKYANWNDPGYVHMPVIYTEMTKKRKSYDTHSVVELVRFIRNSIAHVSELTRPTPIRKILLEDFVFLEYFPNLVIEVYKTVTTHGWDQREEIKYALK